MRPGASALWAAVFALAPALPATAAATLRPGIIGHDDRVAVIATEQPYAAIGQVDVGGYRTTDRCSGTLVAPRIVVTAAHCVVDPRRGIPFRADTIHFAAGVHLDTVLARAVAACVKLREGALSQMSASLDRFERDIAVIVLAEPIAIPPMPMMRAGDHEEAMRMTHAAYPADRRFQLMADRDCKIVGRSGGLWLTDCDSHPGSSGGPLIADEPGGAVLAAVMVGGLARQVTIAVPLATWPGLPLGDECPGGDLDDADRHGRSPPRQ